ncbi:MULTISPECIES: ASCH domain-containing protein [Aurantimonas]|uniref:ASCH domain-containing protein n=1 Tax=Aurantimonas TaxID=182269 RepID=UPI003517A458
MADTLPTKAISIRHPWAWAIVHAGKDIENRDWPTRFRGPVCIHASLYKPRQDDVDDFNDTFCRAVPDEVERRLICPRFTEALSLEKGGIIAVAEIIDCVDASDSPWFFGRYGLVLRNVRRVPLIPVKGALGFFDWRKNLPVQEAA